MAMKFWGVEVKPGESVKCNPGEGKYIHLSQASLGESKVKEKVAVCLKVDDNKLVIGSLSVDTNAQIQYDLVFEKEFELSHSSKNAAISFCGYRTSPPGEEFEEDDSEGKSVSNRDQVKPNNGKAKTAKGASSADKQAKPAKVDNSEVKDEDSSSDDDEDDDSDDDEKIATALNDSDEENDSTEEEDSTDDEMEDATPMKSAPLKRPAESTSKTPAPGKKAKIVTPAGAKTGGEGKKNVHVATPHPSKKTVAKTPANSDKPKQQTPKSGGSVPCKSCTRTFNSESALQAHTKAKHA